MMKIALELALPVSRAARLFALLAAATAPVGAQSTFRVPADHPTIQLAIDVAVNGDTVLVADGRYEEALDLLGKAIEVRLEDAIANSPAFRFFGPGDDFVPLHSPAARPGPSA